MIAFRGGALKASGFRNGLGSGFRGLIDYLQKGRAPELSEVPEIAGEKVEIAAEPSDLPERGRVAWSSTRNLPTDDIDRAPYWMRTWANQDPRVEKPVYHFGVAVAPDEKLGPEQWERIADRLLEGLGVEEHQAVIALHQDREHHHIHIVLNRVGPDGRAWRPSFDALKQQKVLRQLEQELGLRAVPTYGDQRRELERELGIPARELEKPFALKVRDVALARSEASCAISTRSSVLSARTAPSSRWRSCAVPAASRKASFSPTLSRATSRPCEACGEPRRRSSSTFAARSPSSGSSRR